MKIRQIAKIIAAGVGLVAVSATAVLLSAPEKYIKFTDANYAKLPIADKIRGFMSLNAESLKISPTGILDPDLKTVNNVTFTSSSTTDGFSLFRGRVIRDKNGEAVKNQRYEGLVIKQQKVLGSVYCDGSNESDCKSLSYLCDDGPVSCLLLSDTTCGDLYNSKKLPESQRLAISSDKFPKKQQAEFEKRAVEVYEESLKNSETVVSEIQERLRPAFMKGFQKIGNLPKTPKIDFDLHLKANQVNTHKKLQRLIRQCQDWDQASASESIGISQKDVTTEEAKAPKKPASLDIPAPKAVPRADKPGAN
jgi:hypothetical protein